MNASITNALTIDVEDYFQVSAFAPHIARADWPGMPCRVEANIERILLLLEARQIHATFFTLGWIAERYPVMLRSIAAAGHEVASHGYGHLRTSEQSRADFAHDVRLSKTILEQLTGMAVLGYRAPSFSINGSNLWAFDVLQETGYRYSSSIYPIRHDHYGMPDAPRFAWRPRGVHGVLELPISTVRVGRRNFPAGGGGYFRLLPYPVSRWLLRRINSFDGQAGIFYFHPWELDPGQPRPAGLGWKTRFRHYLNLQRMEARLTRLAGDFRWDRMDCIFLESL
ncbi:MULTISPECIES: XrtA system polysaccharide deacetylase [unclassified Janthinobacterium]|uniref:XrtA system polysaccharide deacetylase n=1 Tax=unclassified Janthinobacterium TaxID=2610881 RepID=UPI00161FD79C|nr:MULTISPECIES: XrtA system polysaccharide deacetylase [unclassified Janthinobacterium]MBB5369815.1 polysaccharide deacetylase family protein (PEP-CTERM system associated) [Janthinobacterium sp. K2C7]MBB5382621.1 polysaccharide deacetylase family protein (PEP-CTERM system associated) [Janthinobacterium sp. K2Li3]MBB5384606.1 polysaccharide deacetylase family protein (PEP-CTERM system associated) [Janthinobacterium sp. K2E3]